MEVAEYHKSITVVDFHNDFLEEKRNKPEGLLAGNTLFQTDIPRLKKGGVDVQFMVAWARPTEDRPFLVAKNMLETLNAEVAQNASDVELARSFADVERVIQQKKLAIVFAVEGGYIIENKLENLEWLYAQGARYLTLTWNFGCDWAGGANEPEMGLTDFGKQVVDKLVELGMMIDLSHASAKTVDDVLAHTNAPVVATHSGAYSVNPHARNLSDEHIQEIARRGGVVGMVFYPLFLNNTKEASISDVVKHISYIRKLTGGVDCIALGSDFDGIDILPTGLKDVSEFPNLTKALFAEGYTAAEVEKILGKNILRVFKQICH